MPRYQQLISCTFHIDNLVAVFKAKLGRAQSAAQLCLDCNIITMGVLN